MLPGEFVISFFLTKSVHIDAHKHSKSISKLTENMPEKEFEQACELVALDIL